MKILINLYSKELFSNSEFKTARSSLRNKKICFVVFYLDDKLDFIFELPLSPSMGEMPEELITQFKMQTITPMLNRAIEIYRFFKIDDFEFPKENQPDKEYSFETFGIGDEPQLTANEIVRLKGDPSSIMKIISYSLKAKQDWMVDFNSSLTMDEFSFFLGKIEKKHLIGIEQPVAENLSITAPSNIIMWADETLRTQNGNLRECIKLGYNGFILKPIYFSPSQCMQLLQESQIHHYPMLVSDVNCDSVYSSFIYFLNQFSSWKILNCPFKSPHFFNTIDFQTPFYFLNEKRRLAINDKAIDLVLKDTAYEGQLALTL